MAEPTDEHRDIAKRYVADPALIEALAQELADARDDGALCDTTYVHAIEDGDDVCLGCHATVANPHRHGDCYQQGKQDGALEENLDCATQLAERIGCEAGYFHAVLERVPPAVRLPGDLYPAVAQACELVFADPTNHDLQTVIGLRLTALVKMPPEKARWTREHMMMVRLRRATVQVSIDDNGHTCVSDDGVTCGLCQRDMSRGSDYAQELESKAVASG